MQRESHIYPAFTLMWNSPTIYCEPPSIGFHSRPLHRHITSTHDSLTDIINTMIHMLASVVRQHLSFPFRVLGDLRVICEDPVEKCPVVFPDFSETVKLMEEANGKDFSPRSTLSEF
jgi:hypothetical protein